MLEKRSARYGTWDSAVTPALVAGATIGFSELAVDGDAVYWLESRPLERGRRALVRWTPHGGALDAVPAAADLGTRVHEYGGGAYAVRDGTLVYSERSDDSVWLIDAAQQPRLVTKVEHCRYAGFAIDALRGLVYAVREDHRDRPPAAPENALVALNLDAVADPRTNAGRVIFRRTDFVLAPQLSHAGTQLAWIAWNQPDMPWDATELFVADIAPLGTLTNVRSIAGARGGESIAEACWAADGTLLFTSDRTNWWNIYRYAERAPGHAELVEACAPLDAEFAEPHWVFGRRMLAPLADGRTLCAYIRDGVVRPAIIENGAARALPYGPVDTAPLPYGNGSVYLSVATDRPATIARARDLEDAAHDSLRTATSTVLATEDVSIGEPGAVATDDGEVAYYTFYAPRSARFAGPPDAKPPLLVMSHGGPTAMSTTSFSMAVQWWTTRGFAVAHVNYRGSSGFGRAYRKRLSEAWGVVDVVDCISVARRLVENGRCDPERVAIRGGSSSGMTALLAVATSDVFHAAASLYGVMELESLAAETHKFEARYTDGLIGPLPETRQRYIDRSPVTQAPNINVPVILFQGLDDRAVPPNQAVAMRDALAARGVPVTYQTFEGEGHGFRKAETVQRVLELELAFYRDVFGLTA